MTLPSFLLAWSDWNWFGIFRRLRPERDQRWTFKRTLGLTLVGGIAGATLGLVVAMLLFRQPVGWLPWLVGLCFMCVALCWFSVTAVSWNLRAARMRANPAMASGLQPTRLRFFRWCLGAIYVLLLGVITPLALVLTIENVRAKLAWNRELSRLVRQGERLTVPEILSPRPSAGENAGVAPVFAPYFDYRRVDGQMTMTATSSNALVQLETVMRQPRVDRSAADPAKHKSLVDLKLLADAYRNAIADPQQDEREWVAGLKLPEPGNPAADVIAATAPSERLLGEIAAAAALPRSQFPLHYDEGFDLLLRHLAGMKGIQQTIRMRCTAFLELGQTDRAFQECTNALNIAELMREEPLLISQLVRYAQGSIAISAVWQGLVRHDWTEPQLSQFQQRLERINYLPGLLLAFEGERACTLTTLENNSALPDPSGCLQRLGGRAFILQNQVNLSRFYAESLAYHRRLLDERPQAGLLPLFTIDESAFARELKSPFSPYTVMAAQLLPAVIKAGQKTVRMQAVLNMSVIVLALERHRIAEGAYPETLNALQPRFITALPVDPVTAQPFQYKRTEDGWFLLYSVGPNGKDDGGMLVAPGEKGSPDLDWPWPVPTRIESRVLF